MKIISASINLSKIDKSKIVEGKDGAKYINVSIILNDEKNNYGQDTTIIQEQTKAERESKTPKIYLGNGKTTYTTEGVKVSTAVPVAERATTERNGIVTPNDDDLPF